MSDYGTRTPGQRMWLVGAAGLLVVLVVGGGWLAWRGLSQTAPTLATTPPHQGHESRSAESVFGATKLTEGVPWGFPLTARGAAAAAAVAVAVTGQADAVFDPARFDRVAAIVFSRAEARTQAAQVELARTELDASGWGAQPPSRRSYFLAPLAVRLVSYDPSGPSATVEVWAMTVVGVGDAGGAVFTTSTVDLTTDPDGDGWTVTGLDSVEGPTPMVAAIANAPGRTRGFLRDAVATMPIPLLPDRP